MLGFIIIRQRLFVAATSTLLLCSFAEKDEGTVDNAYATCGGTLQRVVEGDIYPDLGIAAGPRREEELDVSLPAACLPALLVSSDGVPPSAFLILKVAEPNEASHSDPTQLPSETLSFRGIPFRNAVLRGMWRIG